MYAYCSRRCRNESQKKALPESVIHEYNLGRSTSEIGQMHHVSRERVRRYLLASDVQLRSRTAHLLTDKNPTKSRGHSEATRARLRDAAARQFDSAEARSLAAHRQRQVMAEGRVASVSGIEDLVANELDRLGIGFTRQNTVRDPATGLFCACVDFMLENVVALEVNGTFWHTDPRVYPSGPIYASQQRTLDKYTNKLKALDRLRISVVEIWEIDIRDDLAAAVHTALERADIAPNDLSSTSRQSPRCNRP